MPLCPWVHDAMSAGIAVSHDKGRRLRSFRGNTVVRTPLSLVQTTQCSNYAVLELEDIIMIINHALIKRWRALHEWLVGKSKKLKKLFVNPRTWRILVAILRILAWLLRVIQSIV